MWPFIKRYRTFLFHTAYGLPLTVMAILDGLKVIDLGPLLSQFMSPAAAAAAGTAVAVGSLVMHATSDTYHGSLRDDCKDCERPH